MSSHTENNSLLEDMEWLGPTEGQLSVDVIETPDEIIIRSAIAGVTSKELSIDVTKDTVTIRGERSKTCKDSQTIYHLEECYWGSFSRSIILPCDIRLDKINAALKDGILTIQLKKAQMHANPTIIEL